MAKTKALISFAVTAKLICVFVFACADCCFSHEAAQIRLWLILNQEDLGVTLHILEQDALIPHIPRKWGRILDMFEILFTGMLSNYINTQTTISCIFRAHGQT